VTTPASSAASTNDSPAGRSIAVGLDTRGRSASALVWAAEEAERTGSRLQLVSATREESHADSQVDRHDLGSLARRLTMVELDHRYVEGDPVEVLLDSAATASLLVVGCRTLRPAQRIVLGSTSRAVAAWSPVPVVVVPEPWIQPSMASAPIVIGVRPVESAHGGRRDALDEEVLDCGFTRADALNVPLLVMSAFEPAWLQAWSAKDLVQARSVHDAELEERLAHWQARFPDVDVQATSVAEPADKALLEASRIAQLTVVGRHHARALTGRLGGTARGVLHEATRPVMVVPSGTTEELTRELTERRTRPDQTWAPMF
jgi:nucleotide-binding universal stress UspA family protein